MKDKHMEFVEPVDRARFGAPQPCPSCGAYGLGPCFGLRIEDNGDRHAVIDPTRARCDCCGEMFEVKR